MVLSCCVWRKCMHVRLHLIHSSPSCLQINLFIFIFLVYVQRLKKVPIDSVHVLSLSFVNHAYLSKLYKYSCEIAFVHSYYQRPPKSDLQWPHQDPKRHPLPFPFSLYQNSSFLLQCLPEFSFGLSFLEFCFALIILFALSFNSLLMRSNQFSCVVFALFPPSSI